MKRTHQTEIARAIELNDIDLDYLEGTEAHLLIPDELSEALFDSDPDLIEFLRICRDGETPPMDLSARLMERGIDVTALEASIAN